jgi:2,5-dihydroxypyridine 5,6-dioxygenase
MLNDRIEAKWIDAFATVFELCKVQRGDAVAILSETQSRELNVHLSELALERLGARSFHVRLPTPVQKVRLPIRSTGASDVIRGLPPAIAALSTSVMVVDCTVEGLMHCVDLPAILQGGTRVLNLSNEHPDTLERLLPDPALTPKVKNAARLLKSSKIMRVTSAAGSDLTVDLSGAQAVGVWGYTDRPGTLAHWPGGIAVAFPRGGTVNGTLVLDRGDINLTFKRYLETPLRFTIEKDYVTKIEGEGTDAELTRRYFAAWGDREAYATSHVGFGMNPLARYEALSMYDQRDTNGTELRAFAGNFLYSTGANEFANRYTLGHFDLPMRGCTITLDNLTVVRDGVLQGEFA